MSITAAILQIAAFLLPFLIDGIKSWQERQQGGNHEANVQEFREAIVDEDPAAVSARLADQHDRVLEALRGR